VNYRPHQVAGLILTNGIVTLTDRGPHPQPGRAVVYSDRAGSPAALAHRPSIIDAPRYKAWFQVDITRHHDTIVADVPSRLDAMRFRLEADVQWGVTDPALIVANGTADGLGVVRSRLTDRTWRITRRHDIDDYYTAEDRLQTEFERGPIVLTEGITIFSAVIRLHIDDPTAQHQAKERELARRGIVDQLDADLEKSRLVALRQIANGEDDLLFIFLTRHPDQVGSVLQMVAQRREMTQKAQLQLFDKMVGEGFIQEADIEPMRRLLLQPIEQFVSPNTNVLGAPQQPAVGPAAPDPQQAAAPQAQSQPQAAPGNDAGVAGWRTFGPGSGKGNP